MVAEKILIAIAVIYVLNIIVKYVEKKLTAKRKAQEKRVFDKLKQDINEQDTKITEEEIPGR